MSSKQIAFIVMSVILLCAACNQKAKEARERLDKAKAMYERNEFASVKNEIDSIRQHYPKELGVLKEALALMRSAERKEAERNIVFCDSLLPIKLAEAETLRKGFVFEKDTAYETIGHYIWKQQTIERNVKRSYIRAGVDEEGEAYLASVYFGGKAINHTGLKLSIPNGIYCETPAIPYDGGINYRFKDLGNTTEVVTFKEGNGNEALKFIFSNADSRISAEYIGGSPYKIIIGEKDKKAITETYNLSIVLKDIHKLRLGKIKAEKRLAYLEKKGA